MTVESVENVSKTEALPVEEKITQDNTQDAQTKTQAGTSPVKSPAQALRNIQQLLVMGIFPGQAAPEICKAYQLLENMAQKVENDAKESK
jgi:hypothetical protein